MSGIRKGRLDLTEKKRALLEALLREEGAGASTISRIPKREGAGPAPLSFAQQRLWFFDQFEPGSPAYNLASSVLLAGDLNAVALEQALNEVVRRHEALRTTFHFKDGSPVQVIATSYVFALRIIDLSGTIDPERDKRVNEIAEEEAEQQFDLTRGPLLKATLIRLRSDEHVLVLAMHHIVSDAWSVGVLVRELVILYESFCKGRRPSLPDLPIQYADFACWQRQWLQGEVLEKQLSYWRQQLGGSLPVLELPTDRPRPAMQSFNGASTPFELSRSLTDSLRDLSKREGATLFMVMLAAYKVLLYRYTGQVDLIVGTPIANRNRAEIEDLIGFFTNTLVMRTDVSGNPSFIGLLNRIRAAALGAYSHQDLPFEYLVEQLHPDRNLSHSPLAQVVFVMMDAPDYNRGLSALAVRPLRVGVKTAKFDLTLYVTDAGDGLECAFEYNTDLFNGDTITRMSGHLRALLEGITADPLKPIAGLPILTESERRQILIEWANTCADYADDSCVHQLFEAQVERTPQAIALSFEGEQLSYRELNAQANKVAHHLKSLGAKPGEIAGVFMERGVEMIVAVLAIFKSGAACLPLDPSYPSERLSFMLEDAQPIVVITAERLRARLPDGNARSLCLARSAEWMAGASGYNPNTSVQPENIAYVIYTSGSTGRPKGVSMPHRALTNLTTWHSSLPVRSERTLQFASLNFDVSFQELFSTLCAGQTLLLIHEHSRIDIPVLGRFIEENRVQRFHMPVVVLQKLAEEFCREPQALYSLREIMVGGEQLQITGSITRLFGELKECVLYNHYGPSETHVVTSYLMPDDASTWPALPPLGRPIANCQIYLLDENLQPVPAGVPGEVYIGGACLAQGYLRRPELTAERFIPSPFGYEGGARLYKTGDLARHL
ncbi:MAG TPA: amino acid adenylation domain-containing protein, partial [Blastocatellia bacterium]